MAEQTARTGNNSPTTQIGQLNINCGKTADNTAEQTVVHCGECDRFYQAYKTDKLSLNVKNYSLCAGKVDDAKTYLCYNYYLMLTRHNEPYITPALVIKEGYSEITTRNDQFDRPSKIIPNDLNPIVVIGEGGIGKSLFLSKLFFDYVKLSLDGNMDIIPIWLKGDYFGHGTHFPKEWIFHQLTDKYPKLGFEQIFQNHTNRIYIILDAINNMEYLDKKDFVNKMQEWSHFIREYNEQHENVRFVLSSRFIDDLDVFDSGKSVRIYIDPLDEEKSKKFIALFVNSENYREKLYKILRNNSELPFIGIPYFLRKLIDCRNSEAEIKNKTDVILLYIKSLFEKESASPKALRKRELRMIKDIKIYDFHYNNCYFISAIAVCAFHCQKKNTTVLKQTDIDELFADDTKRSFVIDVAIEEGILIKDRSVYRFSHPILQEFFAALFIYSELPSSYGIRDIIRFEDETMNMQVLPHLYNFIDNRIAFVDTLLKNEYPIYAAECVVNNGSDLRKKVAQHLIGLFKDMNATTPRLKELGFYLGRIGDLRFDKKDGYIQPQTISIPGSRRVKISKYPVTNAEFALFIRDGGYEKKEFWQEAENSNWFDYESVFESMFEFWMGIRKRFSSEQTFVDFCLNPLVDKKQCACLAWFLKMEDDEVRGMLRELYSKEKYKKPLLWDDPNYYNPSQPVVGVSIFEANAYCTWISAKTGQCYRLLTQDEWEIVAKSKAKSYVWGNIFDKNICNTLKTDIKAILPVGIIEKNKTAEGIYDINGNIFEWTSTIYSPNDNPLKVQYVVKGGSWVQGPERATSAYIGRAKAWCRNLDVGFRMCLDENS
ncbi:hypothetical protein AGMMS50212_13040 [Spirochaetia bacterium]|nr:hypothetical protein AGMMS50212_13040 [Spirochaetia bacterium]